MIEGRPADADADDDNDEFFDVGGADDAEDGVASAYPKFVGTTTSDNIREVAGRGVGLFSQLHKGQCITKALQQSEMCLWVFYRSRVMNTQTVGAM